MPFKGRLVLASLSQATSRSSLQQHGRCYATQTGLGTTKPTGNAGRRQTVTVFNDDGQVRWGNLTTGEKAARTAQQSFNFALIAAGAAGAAAVFVLLYTDVFSSDSDVTQYNRAVDRVRSDPHAIELLGPSKQITAVGPSTGTSWRRQRVRAQIDKDKYGTERLHMRFAVEGPKNSGTVIVYMLRRADESHYSYGHLALDVPGHQRLMLEDDSAHNKSAPGSMFGIKWR